VAERLLVLAIIGDDAGKVTLSTASRLMTDTGSPISFSSGSRTSLVREESLIGFACSRRGEHTASRLGRLGYYDRKLVTGSASLI
jgi:hypothetical protein